MEKKLSSDIVLDIFLGDFTPKLPLFYWAKITQTLHLWSAFRHSSFLPIFIYVIEWDSIYNINKKSRWLEMFKGIFIPMFIIIVLDLSGTRPIKGSRLANIGPKCIFYSAFCRKQIAKSYSAIWEIMGTLFLCFEFKNTIFQNVLLTHIIWNRFFQFFFYNSHLKLTNATFLDPTRRDLYKYAKKVTEND